jgi:hypothetical protein
LNGGGLSFTSGPFFSAAAPFSYRSVEFADRDNDGDLDCFAERAQATGLSYMDVLDFNGVNFVLEQSDLTSGFQPEGVTAADLTGDGRADLIASFTLRSFSRRLSFVPATAGALAFGPEERIGESLGLGAIAAFDANGDGLTDLLVVAQGGRALETGAVAIKFGEDSDGDAARFRPAVAITPGGEEARRPIIGDFTGDGVMDFAVPDSPQTSLLLYAGNGDGTFTPSATGLPVVGAPSYAAAADLDGDGLDDLVYTTSAGSRALYAFGDPSGSWVDSGTVGGGFSQAMAPTAADIDQDGDLDLLFLLTDRIEVSIGDGQRGFGTRTTLTSATSSLSTTERVLAADIDVDGFVDLLVPGRELFLGLGGGAFSAGVPIQGGGVAGSSVVLVDVDQDGDLDLFDSGAFGSAAGVRWSENLSLGIFGAFAPFTTSAVLPLSQGIIADLDGDGDLDVVGGANQKALALRDGLLLHDVGAPYCGPAVPNSTGVPGQLTAYGTTDLSLARLELRCSELPTFAFGFFLASQTQGDVTGVPGSVGRLCLGGGIGRFVGPGQTRNSGLDGAFELELDVTAFPDPQLGLIPVQPGETWSFQAWHRDSAPSGTGASNFTSAAAVTF